jgi:hypothetical protein
MNGKIDYFAIEEVSKKLPNPNEYPYNRYLIPLFKNDDYLIKEGTELPCREEHFIEVIFEKRMLSDGSGYCWTNQEYGITSKSNAE